MPRIRTVKPEFFDDEKLATVSRDARLTFIGLLIYSDDYGVVKGNSRWLKARIFPYDDIPLEMFEGWLLELTDLGIIAPFTAREETYLYIRNFTKHQVIDRPSKSRNPEPPQDILEAKASPRRSLADDSTSPRRILADGKGREREREEEREVRSAPSAREPEPAAVELDANPPTADASADLRDAPETPPVFQSKNFTVAQDYFDNLLAEYAGLTAEMLLAEIKKADDYCTDNHGRFKRRANGQLKNPRLFLRNWMARVVIPQQPRAPGNGGAARSGRNAVKICAWVDKTQNSESAWKNHEMSNASPPS